jgi:hypothetical protein
MGTTLGMEPYPDRLPSTTIGSTRSTKANNFQLADQENGLQITIRSTDKPIEIVLPNGAKIVTTDGTKIVITHQSKGVNEMGTEYLLTRAIEYEIEHGSQKVTTRDHASALPTRVATAASRPREDRNI